MTILAFKCTPTTREQLQQFLRAFRVGFYPPIRSYKVRNLFRTFFLFL